MDKQMTFQKQISKNLSNINKSITKISKKTARGAKLSEKHKQQLKSALDKLYIAAADIEKVAVILE